MSGKKGDNDSFGFDYDEHTDVPSREEVSSFSSSTERSDSISSVSSRAPRVANHHFFWHALSLGLLVVLLIVGGYAGYGYLGDFDANSLTGNVVGHSRGFFTGFVTNDIDYDDPERFNYELKPVYIDLTEEEKVLRDSLVGKCRSEKESLERQTKEYHQSLCTNEKNALEAEWKDKYDSCLAELKGCS